MTDIDSVAGAGDDDMLEQLLKKASPRPVPSSEDAEMVQRAVRDEWRKVAGRQRVRRKVMQYAVAATVLLGVFAVFNAFRAPPGESIEVASIQKTIGAIYLLGDKAELRQTDDLSRVISGQTIVTGNESGIALAWGDGGSVRMDENTRVEFVARDRIYLHVGRVYFDSESSTLTDGVTASESGSFVVQTEHGQVTHTGTQFMTQTRGGAMIISVREGEVAIANDFHQHKARPGEQVTLQGRQRPSVLSIGMTGGDWEWAGRMAPAIVVDGKPLIDFLRWASREMGLSIEFEGGAEAVARQAILRGSIDKEPSEALRLRLASAALAWRIDGGVLYISNER
ncbi:MAG: FecR family protein [Gammaproteobacteria bacterium]|nr:FecR family protein [Gammaproteobacteria bacterium]NNL51914.1 FecR domain-containing protein [Woeseiaceae bacterium]